jgi:hypothetical protein
VIETGDVTLIIQGSSPLEEKLQLLIVAEQFELFIEPAIPSPKLPRKEHAVIVGELFLFTIAQPPVSCGRPFPKKLQ